LVSRSVYADSLTIPGYDPPLDIYSTKNKIFCIHPQNHDRDESWLEYQYEFLKGVHQYIIELFEPNLGVHYPSMVFETDKIGQLTGPFYAKGMLTDSEEKLIHLVKTFSETKIKSKFNGNAILSITDLRVQMH
jgi:hypothetical protein